MEVNSLFLIINQLDIASPREKKCMKNLLCIEWNLPCFKLILLLPGNGKDYENEFLQKENIINFQIIATLPTPHI